MRNLLYTLILLTLLPRLTYAQQHTRTVSGLVTSIEDAAPLEGVLVAAKGPGLSSGTQQDGMYYIEVCDKDSALVFSLDGFQSQEVRLTKANEYNIGLHRAKANGQCPVLNPLTAPPPPPPEKARHI